MGAWGTGPFDNDDAGDWVFELEDDGVPAVRAALDLPPHPSAEVAASGVAAATVVALALGVPTGSSAEVDDWLAGADAPALAEVRGLAPAAAAAVQLVLEGSELADLYDEVGAEEWRVGLIALEAGLQGGASPAT